MQCPIPPSQDHVSKVIKKMSGQEMKILGLYFSMRPMQENMGRGEWIAFNEKPIHKLLEGKEL